MATTAIMWFRRDLRVRDLPALTEAARADRTVPVFVFDDRLLRTGRFPSANRNAFMLACLRELDSSLRAIGGKLVVRRGKPEKEIPKLAREVGADELHFTADISPWSRRRDQKVIDELEKDGVQTFAQPGAYVIDDPSKLLTGQGKPYTVFTPFARSWMGVDRRPQVKAPARIKLPSDLKAGRLPKYSDLGLGTKEPELAFEPGEQAGRKQMAAFLRSGIESYDEGRNKPSGGSSRMSPYLRWGCVSPVELDVKAAKKDGEGSYTYRSELAWRDFYGQVLQHFPDNVRLEYQEKYRDLEWKRKSKKFDRWCEGTTGFPFVDAGMRQLLAEGWMHNRLRMVVGSFLTKDLHLDWRHGEAHFMAHLLDGDMGSNNGGWQWIASVGTDPKPYFQRLFNPMTQQERYDPDGDYVRRWVPELADVPLDKLAKPWDMSESEQREAGCVIGRDYPEPIVDHAAERHTAQDRYRAAG